MEASNPMPLTLKIVIAFFALSIALDLYTVVMDAGTTTQAVRIAIGVGVVLGLLRGSESVRAIVRVLAVLGMLGGVIAVLRIVPYVSMLPSSMVVLGLGAGVLAVFGSIFTFWVLGQERVEMWMARRSMGAG